MIYGEDQCVTCGGARVSGSNLCPCCLVRLVHREEERRLEMESEIEELVKELEICGKMVDDALRYGFAKNRENIRLHKHLMQRAQSIEKELNDEKNRMV